MPTVPDRTWYDPVLNATLHTGDNAVEVLDIEPGSPVAIDIETPGLDRAFDINCVTLAWMRGDQMHSALLNPVRHPPDAQLLNTACHRAGTLILHNAPFDVPALWHHAFFGPTHIDKIVDTLVLARMAWPNPYDPETGDRDLTSLAVRLLGMEDFANGMALAFKAAGFKTLQAGYEGMDIGSPIYRRGAMADTVATLRLEPIIRDHARRQLTDHGFSTGATSTAQADQIIAVQETVNRVMLRRTARGIAVDQEYLAKYTEQADTDRMIAEAELAEHGLVGGSGKAAKLVEYLDSIGELPPNWPRTATGKLQATKPLLTGLDHPLADAQRRLAEIDKVLVYLNKVTRQAQVTGRCHPQVGILAASQTGRMAYSSPELQQFPKEARPILIADHPEGLSSIDWSQIEPVTMGLLAGDAGFLSAYEAGEDLYGPIQTAAGINRTLAKVVLLATMYGQGITGLARRIETDENQAAQIRRQMLDAMPECKRWMANVQAYAEKFGQIITAAGRVLPVDSGGAFRAVNYCLEPDTPILTADLRHVPAWSVSVGDRLVGFDEHVAPGKGQVRKLRTAVVEAASSVVKESVTVCAADGSTTTCSTDHLWLVRPQNRGYRHAPLIQWRRADELIPGDELLLLGRWQTGKSYTAGYIGGLLDGEGYLTRQGTTRKSIQVVFSQIAGPVMDAYLKGLDELGLAGRWRPRSATSTSPTDQVITSGVVECMKLVGVTRPARFIARASDIYEGRGITGGLATSVTVTAVVPEGEVRLTSIQTSTRTLVANGFLSHNCIQGTAYDVLAHSICEMERQGISDHVVLAMHDELVVDTVAAEDTQRIMLTPPPWLTEWAGRTPILRTDREDLGPTWLKPE